MLRDEFDKLVYANSILPDIVIHPVPESLVVENGIAYYLMDNVGELGQKQPYLREVFILLFRLHQHGVCHGDPRLKNIVYHDEKYKWIDMLGMQKNATAELLMNDMVSVISTCFVMTEDTVREQEKLVEFIRCEYIANISENNMHRVYVQCKHIFD